MRRRRRQGWGPYHDDRAMAIAVVIGAILGAILGLLTADIAVVAKVIPS